MEKPRCGVPTVVIRFFLLPLNSIHSWHVKRTFTYRFLNGTNDLAGNTEQQAVQNAFATWANATGLMFTQVNTPPADFEIEWITSAHGGPGHTPFDGVGNVIAHAFYPRPSGGRDSGQMHFDDAETWSLTGGANLDLEACTLHEIGHLLGLDHSSDTTAMMYEFHSDGLIALTADDLVRIRRLYRLGGLWHTIRFTNGPWQPFGNVEGSAGDRGRFVGVSCAAIGTDLHVCGVTDDGGLWHTIRFTNGPWQPFGNVEGSAGDRGDFGRVGCAAMGEQLHVCGVTVEP
jgi:hypothetical protein